MAKDRPRTRPGVDERINASSRPGLCALQAHAYAPSFRRGSPNALVNGALKSRHDLHSPRTQGQISRPRSIVVAALIVKRFCCEDTCLCAGCWPGLGNWVDNPALYSQICIYASDGPAACWLRQMRPQEQRRAPIYAWGVCGVMAFYSFRDEVAGDAGGVPIMWCQVPRA